MLVKTEIPGYYKDKDTGLVINKKKEELTAFQAAREKSKAAKALEEEVKTLKEDVKEIKAGLAQILEAITKGKND
jgi:predicted  nucleic acid-binding Zn-ribbon protein